MVKKTFGITIIIVAFIILTAILLQIPKTIDTIFIKIDNLDSNYYDYVLNPIIVLIIAYYIISFLMKKGFKLIRN